MMPKKTRDFWITLGLLAIAGLLSLIFFGEWHMLAQSRAKSDQAAPNTVSASIELPVQAKQNLELPPLTSFQETVQRPLFMDNRRPGQEVTEAPPPPVPVTPMTLKLMGVILRPGGKIALLADAKGKYKRLKLKEMYDGWTLVEFGSDRVTMEQAGKKEQLTLLKKSPKFARPPNIGQPAPVPPARPGYPQPPPGQPAVNQPYQMPPQQVQDNPPEEGEVNTEDSTEDGSSDEEDGDQDNGGDG